MIPEPSTPPPQDVPSNQTRTKRGRGWPKGSKNKIKKSLEPCPESGLNLVRDNTSGKRLQARIASVGTSQPGKYAINVYL